MIRLAGEETFRRIRCVDSDPSDTVHVGDKVDIPGIGEVEILANSDLVEGQETAAENNGVVLLPERVVFTAENVADYNF